MVKTCVRIFSLTALSLLFSFGYSQGDQGDKVEYEKRVKKEDFPATSILLIQESFVISKKERFFKESDGQNIYYEYKALYKNKNWSVKFNQEGILVDVEVLKSFKNITDTIQLNIRTYLEKEYKKYNIKRLQIQYLKKPNVNFSDSEFIQEILQDNYRNAHINFELEVEVLYDNDSSNLVEFLFDHSGRIVKKRKVNKRDEDYILY